MKIDWRTAKGKLGTFIRGKAFDWVHRVDTSGVVPISALSVAGENVPDAVHYESIPPDELADTLGQLDVRFEEYTFVDFGSGKGRVLLMASRHPYRRIVGVEFARELHDVATRNLARFRGPRCCQAIESVHCDAAEFVIPSGPLVVYLFNPFREEVMAKVVKNIAASLEEQPRDVVFVCVSRWTATQQIERLPGIVELKRNRIFRMFGYPPPGHKRVET